MDWTDRISSNADISLAKKRLARELKILVVVQVTALFSSGLGLFLFASDIVPDYPDWDSIRLLCGVLVICGLSIFLVVAGWGGIKLIRVFSESFPVQSYVWGCFFLLFSFVLVFPVKGGGYFGEVLLCVLPFYCIVPQFFIARWLAKETKDATMTMEWNGTTNVD